MQECPGDKVHSTTEDNMANKKTPKLACGTSLKHKKENNFISIKSAFDQVSTSQSFCTKGTDPFNISDLEMVKKMPELRRRGQ